MTLTRVFFVFVLFGTIAGFFISCGTDEQPVEECKAPPFIEFISVINEHDSLQNGKITVLVHGGMGKYLYSLDNKTFREINIFDSLRAGEYTVLVVDGANCKDERKALVENTVTPELNVSFKDDIMPLIGGNCRLPLCHGDKGDIPTFESYTSVKSNASNIKTKIFLKEMPPPSSGGFLSDDQISMILEWVDGGAPDN